VRRAASLSFALLRECYVIVVCVALGEKREVTEAELAEAVELFASAARCPCAATPGSPSACKTGEAASVHSRAKAAPECGHGAAVPRRGCPHGMMSKGPVTCHAGGGSSNICEIQTSKQILNDRTRRRKMYPNNEAHLDGLDRRAKSWLREWPVQTELWSRNGESGWVRARPAPEGFRTGLPTLRIAGSSSNTQPDGLYVRFGLPSDLNGEDRAEPAVSGFVDVIVIEACGSEQNFHDKRSRYAAATCSRILYIPRGWMSQELPTRGGGRCRVWEAAFGSRQQPDCDLYLPVRHLRVLYAATDVKNHNVYQRVQRVVLGAHEFLFRHSQLGQFTAPTIQDFLRLMTPTRNIF
jgi:hypothetical protein